MEGDMCLGWSVIFEKLNLNRLTRGDIPARGESKEVSKRRAEIAGFGCQNAENGRINMIDRDRADVDKLG
jgi:hypothetical protein